MFASIVCLWRWILKTRRRSQPSDAMLAGADLGRMALQCPRLPPMHRSCASLWTVPCCAQNSKNQPPQKLDLVKMMVFRPVLPDLRPPPSDAKIASEAFGAITRKRGRTKLSIAVFSKSCCQDVFMCICVCGCARVWMWLRMVWVSLCARM